MATAHIKKGEEVVVLAGKEKGKRGKVLQLLPAKDRAIVEGLMMIKRHEKKSEEKPEGAIVEREGSIHVSNLMSAEKYDARRAK
ncbi:50S ribosomal protein L24 [Pelagicoccus sp. NFK12]|uniref:Large ribosomal subunit protein uL24 n=1 Tax=Pelagicoccus enzymogenes TaxID=2773457 RepID=A0A927IHQ7_9BACT|nr:50S ribosomal protein L24 [Pelagicoccus enzymogenes]MBD5782547.1 50S ribosomal protein L24 [Pelagicoccus enzymogenes]MDQ8199539.1 50S ribosomal protein L24 [Pelagicoccus enzymogenes]